MAAWVNAETIESKVDMFHPILLTQDQAATEVTHVDLPGGVWLISGNINFFESAEQGTVFVAGGIDITVSIPSDGTSPITGQQLDAPKNVIQCTSLPSRLVKFNTPTRVYLNAYSNQPGQPPPRAYAWGYISATRAQ